MGMSLALLAPLVPVCGQATDSLGQQRIPRVSRVTTGAIVGIVRSYQGAPLGGTKITLNPDPAAGGPVHALEAASRGDGWFAIRNIPPGVYTLRVSLDDYETLIRKNVTVEPGDPLALVLDLKSLDKQPDIAGLPHPGIVVPAAAPAVPAPALPYRELTRPAPNPPSVQPVVEPLAEDDRVFVPDANRWGFQLPSFRRYPASGEFQFVQGHWYDPFNGNRLKSDIPIIGNRTFLNLTLSGESLAEGRLLPLPPTPQRPPSSLGLGQAAAAQNLTFSAELFGGDAAFRPPDWRIRVTSVGNLNFAETEAPGLLNFTNPQTTRSDTHLGFQEAFGEVKLKDLSDNYDFVSLRAGIQTFNSDFRGFLFSNSEPGLRLFGNLGDNKYQYNLAAFDTLVKDANSGLNTRVLRKQQVYIANLYRQDVLSKGYTIQFSFHYDKDDPSFDYNVDNFQVRPVPIGPSVEHAVRAYYYGFTGDGHWGRLNLTHAFYQALGHDTYDALAARPVKINAQMGALELSVDRDWIRYRVSMFYASGDGAPRDGTARGFDTILDNPNFAGGIFSFWNREEIDISARGVALVNAGSLVPDLRSGKASGQANFVNPGLFLYNAGMDLDLTPKLRAFFNSNYLRFAKTQSLELLLNQSNIHSEIGIDNSIGLRYRPDLNDNIVLTAGVSMLLPMQGFREIYSRHPLFASFLSVIFKY